LIKSWSRGNKKLGAELRFKSLLGLLSFDPPRPIEKIFSQKKLREFSVRSRFWWGLPSRATYRLFGQKKSILTSIRQSLTFFGIRFFRRVFSHVKKAFGATFNRDTTVPGLFVGDYIFLVYMYDSFNEKTRNFVLNYTQVLVIEHGMPCSCFRCTITIKPFECHRN
jgi:hypothetical protein